jgi:hypothetical protein
MVATLPTRAGLIAGRAGYAVPTARPREVHPVKTIIILAVVVLVVLFLLGKFRPGSKRL